MVRFECDSCHRLKEAGDIWILGFAAEAIGVTAARREISIVSAWDNGRAVDELAVHFCSDECRRAYVEQLFGDQPPTAEGTEEEQVEGRPTAGTTEKRIIRRISVAQTKVKKTGIAKRVKKTARRAS